MTLITEIAHDDQQRQHDEIIIQQAQFFYDSAKRAEQRGEPVKALIHRNIAYRIQQDSKL